MRTGLTPILTELPWLSPCAASLVALGHAPTPDTWNRICRDPGAVLLLLRLPAPSGLRCNPATPLSSRLHEPGLLDEALSRLEQAPPCFVDWQQANLQPIYRAAVTYARTARRLAERFDLGDPEEAWVCGLLAPLGWFAVSAVDASASAGCLADAELPRDSIHTQQRHWGLDCAAIGRRLARRWRLPEWLAAVVGYLRLSLPIAQTFGADGVLFPLTQLAVGLAKDQGVDLGLVDAAVLPQAAATLGLSVERCKELTEQLQAEPPLTEWAAPDQKSLLPDLLRIAADNRRLQAVPLQQRLDHDLDDLHSILQEQIRGEAERLQACKLAALAEFAGGAGHEINNPLAVISGQAQYLLGHQDEWCGGELGAAAAKALHTIIGQTKRIHSILRDLMQFARPATPTYQWFDLPTLLGEVAASLLTLAEGKKVQVEVGKSPALLRVYADAEQVRVALTCLLQNAIEAVHAEGWAKIYINEPVTATEVGVVVEDSGAGPDPTQRDALFDPFYSGRSAGRGKGLGLPIAWRLLRQQGGDVRLLPQCPNDPTRFLVSLPRHTGPAELAACG